MGEHLDDRTLWIGLAVVLACGFAGGLLLSYLRSGNERSPFKAGHRRGGAEASGGCVGPLLIFMGLAVVGVALLSDVSIPSAFGGRQDRSRPRGPRDDHRADDERGGDEGASHAREDETRGPEGPRALDRTTYFASAATQPERGFGNDDRGVVL